MNYSNYQICSILRGGLGNQLFQYSFIRSLQLRWGAQAFFDLTTGFKLDRQANRVFELNSFNIKVQENSDYYRAAIDFIGEKLAYRVSEDVGRRFFNVLETELLYDKNLNYQRIDPPVNNRRIFATGYWQSPLYFIDQWPEISKEFELRESPSSNVKKISDEMNAKRSIAIGMRTYSDSKNPQFHARDGKILTSELWNSVFEKIVNSGNFDRYYVFNLDLDEDKIGQLGLPKHNTTIVKTHKNLTPAERLYLFSSCRSQLFNNSSFYWWGAFLRQLYFDTTDQQIFVSDNFLNRDFALSSWKKF